MFNHSETADFAFIVGIDIAKNVFQVYSVDTASGETRNEQVVREEMHEYFANKPKCRIGMEACGGSQYWARELAGLGHSVRLMDPKAVKPYVTGNKSDKADAEGICRALRDGVRAVAVKPALESDIRMLLTIRERLATQRVGDINHVRGLLMECGFTIPKSVSRFNGIVDDCINGLEGQVDQTVVEELRETVKGIRVASERISRLARSISELARRTRNADHLLSVPGVGIVTMAYMCVLLSDPSLYASARQFAAYLGLVPMHFGSGGKTINTHIPGRCNKHLRAVLVECAQSVARKKHPSEWVVNILQKKPKKVALIAIANRIARQCWAVAKKSQPWQVMPVVPAAA